MKKIFIAGGAHSDIPLIKAAKRAGFFVISSGSRSSDLGHRYSDQYVECDYSDREAIAETVRRLDVEALCASCNDFSALSCSYTAQELGLMGHDPYETALIIHEKDRWRQFSRANGIPSPKVYGVEEVRANALEHGGESLFPLMVKPVDLTGGKGIRRVANFLEFDGAYRDAMSASRSKRVVVEEFVQGTRHGMSCFLESRRVVFYSFDDEHYHLSDYMVSGASSPGSCGNSTIDNLIDVIERIADLLVLVDGIFHVQFIERGPGDPVIIEICRRAPGDLYIDLVSLSWGVDYADWIVRSSAGLRIESFQTSLQQRFVTRHCLMASQEGFLSGFEFSKKVVGRVITELLWGKPGEAIVDPKVQKFGIVFLEYESAEQMRHEAGHLQKLLRVKTR